jgi:tRNA-dihydrouridine synthase C
LRLGWDDIGAIYENATMAAEGGASWITIHARTKKQGYAPPVYWKPIGEVRQALGIPVVANGDIWTLEDFKRCQEETGCIHFMLGRGALANPSLVHQVAGQLGLPRGLEEWDWGSLFLGLVRYAGPCGRTLLRLKQWSKIASTFGEFPYFQAVKLSGSVNQFLESIPVKTGP